MKAVTLRAMWWGLIDPPMIGQYLRAERGRTAYLILDVIKAPPGAKHQYRLKCERRPYHEPGPTDRVIAWRWSERRRSR